MVKIREVEKNDFEDVSNFLHRSMNLKWPAKIWSSLFSYNWECNRQHSGYILLDSDKIVGFIGGIFSRRLVNGKWEDFLCTTSWSGLPEYRKHSIKLLMELLRTKNVHFRNCGSLPELQPLLKVVFKDILETHKTYFFSHLPFFSRGKVKIFAQKEKILRILQGEERRIYLDHIQYCNQILLIHEQKTCLIVMKKRKFKLGVNYGEILYSSDYKFLIDYINIINFYCLLRYRFLFLTMDKRFVKYNPLFSINVKMKSSYMLKTLHSDIKKEDIDNLYTELVLLPF